MAEKSRLKRVQPLTNVKLYAVEDKRNTSESNLSSNFAAVTSSLV